jgi:hypothetical protein
VRFTTREPRSIAIFERGKEQSWRRIDMGFETVFPVSTGKIFEAGFPDCYLQMWAAFLAERQGVLGDRLGCVTVDEAVFSQEVFAAALASNQKKQVITL